VQFTPPPGPLPAPHRPRNGLGTVCFALAVLAAVLAVVPATAVAGLLLCLVTLVPAFVDALPPAPATMWVAGAEAHVCVLLTVLGLLRLGYRVEYVADAVASRRAEDRAVALERARQDGARLTTVETAIFGWLGSFRHPRFRDALALIK